MYYSGKLTIHNDTEDSFDNKNKYYMIFKFSISFNGNKLFLNNSFVEQILSSKTVQNYIYKEVKKYLSNKKEDLNIKADKIITLNTESEIEVNVIGKYLFIKLVYCKNLNIDKCLKCLNKKLKNEKTKIEVLRNEL